MLTLILSAHNAQAMLNCGASLLTIESFTEAYHDSQVPKQQVCCCDFCLIINKCYCMSEAYKWQCRHLNQRSCLSRFTLAHQHTHVHRALEADTRTSVAAETQAVRIWVCSEIWRHSAWQWHATWCVSV